MTRQSTVLNDGDDDYCDDGPGPMEFSSDEEAETEVSQERDDDDDDDEETDERDNAVRESCAWWNVAGPGMIESENKVVSLLKEMNTIVVKDALKMLGTIMPEGIYSAKESEEWEYVEFYVDSGATETVMGPDMLKSVEAVEGIAMRRGVKYEVANGIRIPNLGEKEFVGVSEEGMQKSVKAQICDVNKALMSVKKMTGAGNRVVFDDDGSYIESKATGRKMWMREENNMYVLGMWVKTGF